MRRSSSALLLAVLATTLMTARFALAQTGTTAPDGTTEPLIQDELGGKGEAPPPAEYPYPGASEDASAAAAPSTRTVQPNEEPPERPVRIDEEGEYHYDTTPRVENPSAHEGLARPKGADAQGQYFYEDDKTAPAFSNRPGFEKPVEITSEGVYRYKLPQTVSKHAASFRIGVMQSPDLENSETGIQFDKIYTPDPIFAAVGDYEWKLSKKYGHTSLKFGTGIVTTQGHGTFVKQNSLRRSDDVPIERFTLIIFPNTFTAVYRFQYSETQFFVPFVEGGPGYFTFAELRSDNKAPKLGGALVAVAAGGFNLLLDRIDRDSVQKLVDEYGINHVWFTAEVRHIQGLNPAFDFTSNMVDLGFMLDF